jgi:hypothetical protein
MSSDWWFRVLMITGLSVEQIRFLHQRGRTPEAVEQVQRLGINGELLAHLENLAASAPTIHFDWYMPFCGNRWSPERWGVHYQWTPTRASLAGRPDGGSPEEFVITTMMPAKSDLASVFLTELASLRRHQTGEYSQLQKFLRGEAWLINDEATSLMLLRSFVNGKHALELSPNQRANARNLDYDINVGFSAKLHQEIISTWRRVPLRSSYKLHRDGTRTDDWALELRISIDPKLMVWLCAVRQEAAASRIRSFHATNIQAPSDERPLPVWASLEAAMFQPESEAWFEPKTKEFWTQALEVMSGGMSGLIVDAVEEGRLDDYSFDLAVVCAPTETRLFGGRGKDKPIQFKWVSDNRNDGKYAMLEVTEMLWYGVGLASGDEEE